jgi:hypothetical protein
MAKSVEISQRAVDELPLSPQVKAALADIQAEIAGAYRERFIEMIEALNKQASALDRIQTTLHILVKHLAPRLEGEVPAVLRVAEQATGSTPTSRRRSSSPIR